MKILLTTFLLCFFSTFIQSQVIFSNVVELSNYKVQLIDTKIMAEDAIIDMKTYESILKINSGNKTPILIGVRHRENLNFKATLRRMNTKFLRMWIPCYEAWIEIPYYHVYQKK